MPGLRPRRALIALLCVAGLGAALVGLRVLLVSRVESALAGREVGWERRDDQLSVVRWEGLSGPGVEADELTLQLAPTIAVTLDGARLDAAKLRGGEPPQAPSRAQAEVPIIVRDLTLRWGTLPLIEGLEGSIAPELDLRAPGGALVRRAGTWTLSLTREVSLGPVSGEGSAELVCADECALSFSIPAARISHELLAAEPLPPAPLVGKGAFTPDNGFFELEVTHGALTARLDGSASLDPPMWQAEITVPPTDLRDVLAPFGSLIPEARRAQVRGVVGLTARRSPDGWSLVPTAEGLAAGDVLRDPEGLRGGTVTWRVRDAEGGWTVRSTGPGQPGYVPLRSAGWLPAAVIAAEDSAFREHGGFDLGAIREALDQAAAGAPLRGGSSLTQQLAKNLFLDGRDRTLVRKLRELLYTLEMERTLGKEHILELYLNVVEFGPDLHGIRAAADRYFAKRPERLSIREAAFLAAILPAPTHYYQRAYLGGRPPDARIDRVLENMVQGSALSLEQAGVAQRSMLRFVPPPR